MNKLLISPLISLKCRSNTCGHTKLQCYDYLQHSADLSVVMWWSGWHQDRWAGLPQRTTPNRKLKLADLSAPPGRPGRRERKHRWAASGAESYTTCRHPGRPAQRSATNSPGGPSVVAAVLNDSGFQWSYLSWWTTSAQLFPPENQHSRRNGTPGQEGLEWWGASWAIKEKKNRRNTARYSQPQHWLHPLGLWL